MLDGNFFRQDMTFSAPDDYIKRMTHEDKTIYRSDFQRDRDRVLYSKPFRRLNGKTQVFLPYSHDYVRNRLTHTLEVSQISRVTAKFLGLNAELTEAIALAHDIGHTPFGHVGEDALNLIMNECISLNNQKVLEDNEKGFKHNWQSIRICCELQRIYPELQGINLTNFTLWGILNHSKIYCKHCSREKDNSCFLNSGHQNCPFSGKLSLSFYDKYANYMNAEYMDTQAWSFEGLVVNLADEIAQRHHDVEDAIIMQILNQNDILEKIDSVISSFPGFLDKDDHQNLYNARHSESYFLNYISKFIVNLYNKDLINNTLSNFEALLSEYNIEHHEDFRELYSFLEFDDVKNIVSFSDDMKHIDDSFSDFLKNTILNSFWVQRIDGKGIYVIRKIFQAYMDNPQQLNDATIISVFNNYEENNYDINSAQKSFIGQKRNEIASPALKKDTLFQKSLLRTICDHIAGMTDSFLLSEYTQLYGEKSIL